VGTVIDLTDWLQTLLAASKKDEQLAKFHFRCLINGLIFYQIVKEKPQFAKQILHPWECDE
jgi:hypothetical protein